MNEYKNIEETDEILSRELVLSERKLSIENISNADLEKIMEKTLLFRINQIKSSNPNDIFSGIDTIKNLLNETKMFAIIDLLISSDIGTLLTQKLISFCDYDRIVASACDLIKILAYYGTKTQISKIITQELVDALFDAAERYSDCPEAHNCFKCIYSIISINVQYCTLLHNHPFFNKLLKHQEALALCVVENIAKTGAQKPKINKFRLREWCDIISIISCITECAKYAFSDESIFEFMQMYILPIQMNISIPLNITALHALNVLFKLNKEYCSRTFMQTKTIRYLYYFLENSNQILVDSTLCLLSVLADEQCNLDISLLLHGLLSIISKYTWCFKTDAIVQTFDIISKLANCSNFHEVITSSELLPILSNHFNDAPFEVREVIAKVVANFILAKNDNSLKELLKFQNIIFTLIEYMDQIDKESDQMIFILSALSLVLTYLNNTKWSLISKEAIADAVDRELIEFLIDEPSELSFHAKNIFSIISGESK